MAIAAALVLPQAGTAFASGSAHPHTVTAADDTYGGGGVLGGSAGGGAGGVLGGTAGGLPFTGANLLLILGSGAALVGAGVGARSAASRRA
jgi:hypothetical protein